MEGEGDLSVGEGMNPGAGVSQGKLQSTGQTEAGSTSSRWQNESIASIRKRAVDASRSGHGSEVDLLRGSGALVLMPEKLLDMDMMTIEVIELKTEIDEMKMSC